MYIDLEIGSDLREKLGAPGDFAQAYVIKHEFGHHVQKLLGTPDMGEPGSEARLARNG